MGGDKRQPSSKSAVQVDAEHQRRDGIGHQTKLMSRVKPGENPCVVESGGKWRNERAFLEQW